MQLVLFVCTGNTCRSPMAECIANNFFANERIPFQAFSRGVNVLVPTRASDNAVKALRFLYKLDLESHISRQVTRKDIENASLVLTMTDSHKQYLNIAYRGHEEKIHSLYGYVGDSGKDIRDPYGMDLYMYKACAEEIDTVIKRAFR